ncbi:AidA/PixA family protein [Flavobacterium sp. AG291]|uniref:AidA/PixA family protein n=1 Tax=Flavobacterium sp. AG291 TaxID=2184000 RepID=UPI000E0AAF81|nr:AidA/PixA family protein [Flavobacterium sp. AG291]RDI11118.1 inclusion body protein [Flavobacterium sp. AG291]
MMLDYQIPPAMELNAIDAGLLTVTFIIDTQYILTNFPDAELNKKSPVRIDGNAFSMLADMRSVVTGYNTRNLVLKGAIADVIVFAAEPKHYIARECVQLFSVSPMIGRLDIQPFNDGIESEGEKHKIPEGKKFMAMIRRKGTEQLEIRFSVYTLQPDGTYGLHGIFYTDQLKLEVE